MKKVLSILIISVLFLVSCKDDQDILVNIHTPMGTMKVLLYDEAPLHKKNFLELAQAGKYDSTIWHRVMEGFMIQGGNVFEKEGIQESPSDRIPAEFIQGLMHTKGALAAARQPDQANPEKMSSSCQFYIVQGTVLDEQEMTVDQIALSQGLSQLLSRPEYDTIMVKFQALAQQRKSAEMNKLALNYVDLCEKELGIKLKKDVDPERLKAYTTLGGSPHLDGEYTIFGRVVEGLDVIDKIAAVEVGRGNRPNTPVHLTMTLEPMKKKQITEKYGYKYAE
ncbi:MAG: peptidylprolyl isomerase [Cyclobacteriaceae bacterium]